MKHSWSALLIGGIAAIVFGQIASAADLPRKAPAYIPPPPPVLSWNGFYIGGNVGGGWLSGQDYTFTDLGGAAWHTCGPCSNYYSPAAFNGGSDSAIIGGLHVGYNWQFAPAWLLGVEGDFTWTDLKQSVTGVLSSPGYPVVNSSGLTFENNVKWLASLRGRVGWLVTPDWLAYATGGVAWAHMDQRANATCPTGVGLCYFTQELSGAPFSDNSAQTGFVVGGGAEYQFAPHWRGRVEYLYYGFNNSETGTSQFLTTGGAPATCNGPTSSNCNAQYTFSDVHIQTVRVGLSYAF